MFFFEAPWLTKYLIAESCYKVCDEQPPQKKKRPCRGSSPQTPGKTHWGCWPCCKEIIRTIRWTHEHRNASWNPLLCPRDSCSKSSHCICRASSCFLYRAFSYTSRLITSTCSLQSQSLTVLHAMDQQAVAKVLAWIPYGKHFTQAKDLWSEKNKQNHSLP